MTPEIKSIKLANTQLHKVISSYGLLSEKNELYKRSLESLGFSARIVHALHGRGIDTLGDLLKTKRYLLARIRNIGTSSLAEIDRYLEQHQLCMEM